MKLPSDKLYIPRISVRNREVYGGPFTRRRRKRLLRLGHFRTLVAGAFLFVFIWLIAQFSEGALHFFGNKQAPFPDEIPLQIRPAEPVEKTSVNEFSIIEKSREKRAFAEPMPIQIPELKRPSPSEMIKAGSQPDKESFDVPPSSEIEKSPGDIKKDQESRTIHNRSD